MKKIFIILYGMVLMFSLQAQNVSIETIEPNNTLYGTKFFPLFVGEKWEWKLSDSDNIAILKWEITQLCTIKDNSNDLENVLGFKVDINDTAVDFYLINLNGFISSYEKKKDKYYITKILPIDTAEDKTWMSGSDNYKITLSTDDIVKIEFSNEDGLKYGYQLFKKSIGPSEIFTYKKSNTGEDSIKWTLSEYTSYDDILSQKEITNFSETDESHETVVTTTTTTTTIQQDIITNDYDAVSLSNYIISSLSKNKTYIQIGAYSKEENAFFLLSNAKKKGYDTYILEEKSNIYGQLYKVIIAVSPLDEENILFDIRNELEKDAFVYSRGK